MNGPNRIFLLILLLLEISYVRTQSCIDTTLIDKSRANNVCNDLLNFYFDPICGCDGKYIQAHNVRNIYQELLAFPGIVVVCV